MKRVVLSVLLLLVVAVSAPVKAETAPKGPAVIDLKMGVMVLPFKHAEHQKVLKDDCSVCHASKIGKIEGWGKDTAHKICIACHELEDKGPTQCRQCHKKKAAK